MCVRAFLLSRSRLFVMYVRFALAIVPVLLRVVCSFVRLFCCVLSPLVFVVAFALRRASFSRRCFVAVRSSLVVRARDFVLFCVS